MNLFLDMDGVLADFDSHYENLFGSRPDKKADNVNWKLVEGVKDFYADIPPMQDMWDLWKFAKPFNPTILTGVPSSVEEAANNKRSWIKKHLGSYVPVICCRSKLKWMHAQKGDILVDDWEKYRHLWEAAGGYWVTHTSANASINKICGLLLTEF